MSYAMRRDERVRGTRGSDQAAHRRARREARALGRRARVGVRDQPPGRLEAPARAARGRHRARARGGDATRVLPEAGLARRGRRLGRALPQVLDESPRRPGHRAEARTTMSDPGRLRLEGEHRGVRFERRYDASPPEVWAALTE